MRSRPGLGLAARPPALERARPGLNQVVAPGEVAAHEVRRLTATRRTGIEAPKEDLHQRPRDLCRKDALRGLVEAADVERARVAKRERSDAGRKRVVDVDDVELDSAQERVKTLRDIERKRRASRLRAARHRDAGADGEDRRSAVAGPLAPPRAVEESFGTRARGVDQAPRLTGPAAQARGRGNHHAVPTLGELSRRALDELVDLVALPPRKRGHLRDREPICATRGHARSIGPRAPAAPFGVPENRTTPAGRERGSFVPPGRLGRALAVELELDRLALGVGLLDGVVVRERGLEPNLGNVLVAGLAKRLLVVLGQCDLLLGLALIR